METNKLHFSEVNPIDFPDSDEYKMFEEKILQAIGNIIDDNEVRKKYFALEIYKELPNSINIGKDLEKLGERVKLLLAAAEKAKEASKEFYSKLMQIHSESESFPGDPFEKILDKLDDALEAIKIFDQFIQEAENIKKTFSSPKEGKLIKSGPQNSVPLIVSTYLAFTYHRFFGKPPGVGRNKVHPHQAEEELGDCVFDKILDQYLLHH